jgi:Zn-finger nucleic acid-binding protein
MICPGCGAAMTALTLDGHMGTQVEIDLCPVCQVIWFDKQESLRLAPSGTLRLFHVIAERRQASPSPLKPSMKCPRCGLSLLMTHDRQRNTPFAYWRCPREHGRLTTFFDFLREKDFVRPLSPAQLAELRASVQTINCSNCGGPIDLVHASACAHCGTAISMLDVPQIGRMVEQLRNASADQPTLDPTLPLRLELEKQHVETLFATLRAGRETADAPFGLVELGLRALSHWFI